VSRLVAIGLLALSVPALAAPPAKLAAFAGTYQYAGGAAEEEALAAAIETVVQKMNFLIRGIARSKLKKGNRQSAELTLQIGDQITVIRPGQPTISAPADGTPITWRSPDGDDFQVAHGLDGDRLFQTFLGPKSFSRNDFVLSADGSTVTVYTRIVAKHVPAPIEFHTTYRRIAR
jgi:hypothetical protein